MNPTEDAPSPPGRVIALALPLVTEILGGAKRAVAAVAVGALVAVVRGGVGVEAVGHTRRVGVGASLHAGVEGNHRQRGTWVGVDPRQPFSLCREGFDHLRYEVIAPRVLVAARGVP